MQWGVRLRRTRPEARLSGKDAAPFKYRDLGEHGHHLPIPRRGQLQGPAAVRPDMRAGCQRAGLVDAQVIERIPGSCRRGSAPSSSMYTAPTSAPRGALLVATRLGSPGEHALISLLALNGLRVSEATGASIEALGVERGHRTLVITRKGGKVVTIPLAPRTARTIDLAVGERVEGPIFGSDGQQLDRHGAARVVHQGGPHAGITKPVSPPHAQARIHHRRAGCGRAAAGCPGSCVPRRSTYDDALDRARGSLDRHATYIVAAYHGAAGSASDCPRRALPGRTTAARRSPGSQGSGLPGAVTDRDPNCDHEPPLGMWWVSSIQQMWQ